VRGTQTGGIADAEVISAQVKHIEKQRLLLSEPDPVAPLLKNVTQLLREELNRLLENWEREWAAGEERLKNDVNWQHLSPEQRYSLRASNELIGASKPEIMLDSSDAILTTLDKINLSALRDRIAALPTRFQNILVRAAELMEPEAQFVQIPRRTLKTTEDLDSWVEDVKRELKAALEKGPVIIR